MYFDFGDYRPDITPVGQVISWREGLLLSIIAHMAIIIVLLLSPRLFPEDPAAEALARLAQVKLERPPEETRFVFVDPKVDLESLRAPDLAPLSDKNRVARSPETAPAPVNPLPNSRGNTPDRVERADPDVARGRGNGPDPSLVERVETPASPSPDNASPPSPPDVPESTSAVLLPSNKPPAAPPRSTSGGALGDALRNLGRYINPEQFENTQGGAQFGNIQFDTKGVEFGPWVRRFAAQVRRNWDPLIPMGPMMLRQKGHVVITLNVHKNGAITDVTVAAPCPVEGYNTAAFGALTASNPTQPLPPEYPADRAFFTITFFYNERPPDR